MMDFGVLGQPYHEEGYHDQRRSQDAGKIEVLYTQPGCYFRYSINSFNAYCLFVPFSILYFFEDQLQKHGYVQSAENATETKLEVSAF